MSKKTKLKAPSSIAVRVQVGELLSGSPAIAGAAALGVCWRGANAPRVRWRTGQAAAYGAAVLDHLLDEDGRNMPWAEFSALSVEAIGLIADSLPSADEEEEAMGNSEAQEECAST